MELWSALANELELDYDVTTHSFSDKLQALHDGHADIGLGCISITPERESYLDFSLPIMNSGYQAVSLTDESAMPTFSTQSRRMLLILMACVLFYAHLMWWTERGRDTINDRYFPGIFEAVWFSIVTMSTVGYGDISPKKWVGRISAILMILTGVTAFGIIFGQFAADAMQEQARYPVQSIKDLNSYTIATKTDTAAAEFLRQRGIDTKEHDTIEEAFDDLLAHRANLVLFDKPFVDSFVQQHQEAVQVGPLFSPHYYGIAMKEGSDLKERLDQAILKMKANGLYQAIYDRWF